ncbi:MAG: small, acid-soluble spore protein, alpha/beta type [Christensenellales bacterium]|jgi:small acid-soluble spore protein A (major alpha-type SASP)
MARRRKRALIPESQQALDSLKTEIASQLGVDYNTPDKGHLTTRQNGSVGGEMVRRMIAFAEQSIKD